jgi:hypothetical protein
MGKNPLTGVEYAQEICSRLDPDWRSSKNARFYCGLPNNGQGYVEIRNAKARTSADDDYIWLSFWERFGEKCNDWAANPFREMVSYFIAGACGPSSIPSAYSMETVEHSACQKNFSSTAATETDPERVYFREDLDEGILDGIKESYSACSADPNGCLNARTAQETRWRWIAIIEDRKQIKELKERVVFLNKKFNKLIEQIKGQYDFLLNIAGLNLMIPEFPQSVQDYLKIIQILNMMIKIAESKIAEEREGQDATW